MAYNLESLVRILKNILNPDQNSWILDPLHAKPQLETLLEKACFLKQVHESSASGATEILESQIIDAAHRAEDLLEPHMVDQMLSQPRGRSFNLSPQNLQDVIAEFDSALNEMTKITSRGSQAPTSSLPGSSFTPDPSTWDISLTGASFMPGPVSSKSILVGLDNDMNQLKERLAGEQPRVGILPIVGMGGIGKSTLARCLYDDPLITSHFDTRAWTTISQDYNIRLILLSLLGCTIGKLSDEMVGQENDQLGLKLHQSLYGKRYLIVLDDIWSPDAWDKIRRFFPKEKANYGSWIIVTTRESDVTKDIDFRSPQHEMHILAEDESWKLLRAKVFQEAICKDPRLEKIGQKIASNCGGLPLAIDVIAGLLKECKGSEEAWERIANDVSSAIAEKDEQFSKILTLSYDHLPHHLRPCFLYMGAFPEDYEIRASKLVKLWVAEGFLKSLGGGDESLEEAGEEYLNALVDRNLLSVRQKKSNGKARSYGIHDLLRDLCVRKASTEKFFYITNSRTPKSSSRWRRISFPASSVGGCYTSRIRRNPLARSFLCIGFASPEILSPLFFALRFLRVLDILDIKFYRFPDEILELVNLRYLAFSCRSSLPSEISRLRNLQTLILQLEGDSRCVSSAIWDLPELRHVKLKNRPIFHAAEDSFYTASFVHEKLQTISLIYARDIEGTGILTNIPNIKNLRIYLDLWSGSDCNFSHLHKLETFNLKCSVGSSRSSVLGFLTLPPSIRKLTLYQCLIPWRVMATVIGSLPNLEVLKIRNCEFRGLQAESEQLTEEEVFFRSLQFLLLENMKNLDCWPASLINLPRLRHLVIRDCPALDEIPPGIGDIPTLETIELDESNPGLVASVRRIQDEQYDSYGNDSLQVRISR